MARRPPQRLPAANVTVASAPTERKVLYWYDPMVPTQKFDKPGKSPYMDMPLMPKYADEDTQDSTGLSVSAQAVQALGCVQPKSCKARSAQM